MADKRISQLIERVDIANNDVLPIVASGATTTNKVTISTIQDWMQQNLDVGVTSVGITIGSTGTDVNVTGSPITTSGNITINIPTASATNRGLLSSADWSTFNDKQPAGNYVTLDTTQTITAHKTFTASGGQASITINHSNGAGHALDITKAGNGEGIRVVKSSGTGNAVTIIGSGNSPALSVQKSSGLGDALTITGGSLLAQSANFVGNIWVSNGVQLSSTGGASTTILQNISGTGLITSGGNGIGFNGSNNFFFSGSDKGCAVFVVNNTGTRNYTLQDASGTLAFTSQIPADPVGGTGTTNQIPKFSGTSTLTNSNILDNGTEVNIQSRLFVTSGGQQFVFTPNLGTTSNRIETTGSLPLEIVSGGNITFAAGGATPQITLASSGAVTFANKITINTPSDGIGVLLNGRTSDNFSSIRFGANTGGGQYNSINVSSSSFDIISIGNTPITFGTNNTGGGGTRMTIGGDGTITLAGALSGTSASFTGGTYSTINSIDNVKIGSSSSTWSGIHFTDVTTTDGFLGYNKTSKSFAFAIDGTNQLFTLASTGAATFSGSVTIEGSFTQIRSGNELRFWRADNAIYTKMFDAGSTAANGFTFDNLNAEGFHFKNNGTTIMRMNSTGSVGIGTPSPVGKFEIASAANTYLGAPAITFTDTSGSGNSNRWIIGNIATDFGSFNIASAPTPSSTTFTPRLTITNSGNVGIGTTSPSDRLHVDGSVRVSSTNFFRYDGDTGLIGSGSSITGGTASQLGIRASSDILFATNGATERMRITSGGNVGIGTSTFNYSVSGRGYLAINGTSNSIIEMQNNSSAAGYLFAASDNLELTAVGASRFLRFTTNDVEKMRITSGGFLKASNTGSYIGVSSSYHEFNNNTSGSVVLYLRSHGASNGSGILVTTPAADSSEYFFGGNSDGVARVRIYTNGNIVNVNNSYGSLSDIKLKENIEDATPKLDDLMKVKVRNYNLIGDDKKQIGVIAQELEEVFPAMIDESEDFEEVEVPQVDEEGNEILNEEGEVVTTKERISKGTTTKSVKYSVFVPMLIKAMQEQQEQIKSLTEQVEALKSQING